MITIEKDGLKFIGLCVLSGLVLLFLFWPSAVLVFLLAVGVTLFFRETRPEAKIGNSQIVSPASGKIVDIRKIYEPDYLKKDALRVSIFMSLLDEHVNYTPITGEVAYLNHQPGGFRRAYLDEASQGNEAQKIGFRSDATPYLMKQIAGVVARRIVCRCRIGDDLKAGEKIGLIRFGSRVELFFPLPLSVRLDLKPGEKVRGGRTVIGTIL
jgi:phosphatidylserine decarboxylase